MLLWSGRWILLYIIHDFTCRRDRRRHRHHQQNNIRNSDFRRSAIFCFSFKESLKIKKMLCWVSNANSCCFYENDVANSSLFKLRAQIFILITEMKIFVSSYYFFSFRLFIYLCWSLIEHGPIFTHHIFVDTFLSFHFTIYVIDFSLQMSKQKYAR